VDDNLANLFNNIISSNIRSLRDDITTSVVSSLQKSFQLLSLDSNNDNNNNVKSSTKSEKQILLSSLMDHARLLGNLEYIQDEISLLGEGRFGKVYKGKYDGKKTVAVKKLIINLKNVDKKALEPVQKEICIMCLCHHRNIIELIGADIDQGVIVSELAECSLSLVIHNDEKRPSDILLDSMDVKIAWMIDIAAGLRYLHAHRIIHRDLKPENILLVRSKSNNNYIAKISDFGVATASHLTSTMSSQKITVGTYPYNAPEILDDPMYSSSSDIYAYGICMNELLTRQRPWYGYNLSQIISNVLLKKNRPSIYSPIQPTDIDGILISIIGNNSQGCLSQEPENRPKADEIYQQLLPYDVRKDEDRMISSRYDDGKNNINNNNNYYRDYVSIWMSLFHK
jgi:serine/threonine protein kinase